MAIASNPLETFIWGSGGSMRTPEQVAREREIAAAMMGQSMDYSPVEHWLQGAARASQGLVGGLKDRWAGEAEQRGREGFQSQWDSVFGGSASPVAAALSETTPAIGAANQMAGAPVTDWLEYANQGATRNQPLAPELVNAMSFLPEMGVTMRVVSGGQDAKGANRVGSTRHDHGNAGDVDFYQNGRKLDWNNEADLPILSNIVSQARANGVTGIGAGDDYMGAGRLHIGFGNEAVWGAGGKSENAPDWLRAAYSGAPSPARTQVAQAGGGNPSVAQLLSLAGNEWANPGQSSVVSALLGQAMQQQDPRYQQQLALGDLQRQQVEIELERLRSPAAPAPDYGFIELPNGQIVRTDATSGTIQDMGQFGASPMGDFSTVTIDVPGVGPQTFNTADPAQYQAANQLLAQGATEVKTPGVSVTTNAAASAPPPGYQNVFDDQGRLVSQSIIPNGPAWQQQEAAIDTAMNTLGQIESIINDPNLSTAVGIGGVLPAIPNTAQAGLVGRIEQLQGAAFLQAFESLKGGGQITQIEGDKATQAIARLNRAQTQEDFTAALNELAKIVHTGMNRARGNIGMESIGEFKPFSAGAGQSQGAIPRTQPNTTSGGVTWSFVD